MRLLLKTVTIGESKAGTKVAPPGLLSVFDRDKETPARLVHREFLDAQCQPIACFVLYVQRSCLARSEQRAS
jgi:hypothetical protein